MRLNSPMVMVAPSSKVAMRVSSGRLGRVGEFCAKAEIRQTKRARLGSFMGGCDQSSTRAPSDLSANDGRGRGLRPWLAALDLDAPAAFLEVVGGLLSSGVADLDFVVDRDRAAGSGEAGGDALVLDDVGAAFEGGDAALYAH